jgi:RNA polymerase sigma-70 factor (ECF subfamily)
MYPTAAQGRPLTRQATHRGARYGDAMPVNADDDDLASAFADGAETGLRRVWDRYGSLLFTFCVRALNDRELAADCVQETFVSAWRSRAKFDPDRGSLPAWLLGIARHRVVDTYRSRSRTPLPVSDSGFDAPGLDAPDALIDRLLIADALATLGGRQRRIIELAFYEGLSQSAIAERLELPLGTVKSDVRRTLRRLRAVLTGGDDRA